MTAPRSEQTPYAKQFRADEKCSECGLKLSRYNQFTVCGPCRVRLLPEKLVEALKPGAEEELEAGLEQFPRRRPVRRLLVRE